MSEQTLSGFSNAVRTALLGVVAAASLGITQPAKAQEDPTLGFTKPLFGMGGHTCKEYDDLGNYTFHTEGIPPASIVSYQQHVTASQGKYYVPMPQELVDILPQIPFCPVGKHHVELHILKGNPQHQFTGNANVLKNVQNLTFG